MSDNNIQSSTSSNYDLYQVQHDQEKHKLEKEANAELEKSISPATASKTDKTGTLPSRGGLEGVSTQTGSRILSSAPGQQGPVLTPPESTLTNHPVSSEEVREVFQKFSTDIKSMVSFLNDPKSDQNEVAALAFQINNAPAAGVVNLVLGDSEATSASHSTSKASEKTSTSHSNSKDVENRIKTLGDTQYFDILAIIAAIVSKVQQEQGVARQAAHQSAQTQLLTAQTANQDTHDSADATRTATIVASATAIGGAVVGAGISVAVMRMSASEDPLVKSKSEVNDLTAEVDQAQGLSTKADQEFTAAETNLQRAKDEVPIEEGKFPEAQREDIFSERKLNSAKLDDADADQGLEVAKAEVAKTKTELAAAVKAKEAALRTAKDKLTAAENEVKPKKADLDSAIKEDCDKGNAQTELDEANARLTRAEAADPTNPAEITQAKADVATQKAKLAQVEKNIKNLSSAKTAFDTAKTNLTDKQTALDNGTATAQERVNIAKENSDNAEAKLEAAKANKEETGRNLEAAEAKKQTSAEAKTKLPEAKAKVQRAEAARNAAETKKTEAAGKVTALNQKLVDKAKEMNDLWSPEKSTPKQREKATEELNKLDENRANAKEQSNRSQSYKAAHELALANKSQRGFHQTTNLQ